MSFWIAKEAVERLDGAGDVVTRAELKVDPTVVNRFVVRVIMRSGVVYEGDVDHARQRMDWCATPNCACRGTATLRSPLELGVTIEN